MLLVQPMLYVCLIRARMTLDRQAFQTLLGPLHKLIANNVAVNYLRDIPSLRDRTTEELYNLAELVEKTYSAGTVIQDEKAPVEKLFIIREGDCVIYKQGAFPLLNTIPSHNYLLTPLFYFLELQRPTC